MPSIGDIYRFTVRSTLLGQDIYNVDFKRVDTLPANPLTDFELARSYHNEWATLIQPTLGVGCVLREVLAENLTDGLSFASYAADVPGVPTGEPLPSFVTLGISLQRSTKLTRNGYKRISGIIETQVTGNNHAFSQAISDQLEQLFQNTVVFEDLANPPDTFQMETVIVGRTPNINGVYELDLSKINPVSQAVLNPIVTTQRTRKPGL